MGKFYNFKSLHLIEFDPSVKDMVGLLEVFLLSYRSRLFISSNVGWSSACKVDRRKVWCHFSLRYCRSLCLRILRRQSGEQAIGRSGNPLIAWLAEHHIVWRTAQFVNNLSWSFAATLPKYITVESTERVKLWISWNTRTKETVNSE